MTEKPEKTGYTEREYRIYGHKCTRRRYIIEWWGVVLRSVALSILVVFDLIKPEPPFLVVALAAVGGFIASMYYGIRNMNVNGYDDEKTKDDKTIELWIPWKAK